MPLIHIGDLMLNFGGTQGGESNLIPFTTIAAYFDGHKGFLIASINLLGNVILLVPPGFLIPFAFPSLNRTKIIVVAIFSGFAIELLQLILEVGIFDIDDVILNALGVIAGFWCYNLFIKIHEIVSKQILITIFSVLILSIIALTGIYYVRKGRLPVSFGAVDENGQASFPGQSDPCKGTGGTGEIIAIDNHAFILKRSDGVEQKIIILENTSFRSSAGLVSQSDIKPGDRITLVTGPDSPEGLTAAFVLICGPKRTGGKKTR